MSLFAPQYHARAQKKGLGTTRERSVGSQGLRPVGGGSVPSSAEDIYPALSPIQEPKAESSLAEAFPRRILRSSWWVPLGVNTQTSDCQYWVFLDELATGKAFLWDGGRLCLLSPRRIMTIILGQ